MTLDHVALLLIVVAFVQWPITLAAVYFARRERQTALTFTVGVFIVLSIISTAGAVLGWVHLHDIKLPPGMFTVTLIGIFLAVALPQPLWALAVLLGKFR